MTRQILSLSVYGVHCRVVEVPDAGLCTRLRALLPPEAHADDPAAPDVQYEVRRESRGPGVTGSVAIDRDGRPRWAGHSVEEALYWLRADIDFRVALLARVGLFVHAGVVGWRDRAMVIPGRSGSGKTSLVEELVQLGARYYSDEYAVLDDAGRVHPYARVPSSRGHAGDVHFVHIDRIGAGGREPLPVALLVATIYREGTSWRPEVIVGGRAVLPLVDNTVLARGRPRRMMRLAATIARSVVTLKGLRPTAALVAPLLLEAMDDLLDRRPSPSTTMVRPPAESVPESWRRHEPRTST